MRSSRLVLVTGATGTQGRAVVSALLGRGHRVRAFTRHPDAERARRIAGAKVEIVAGDFEDADSVAMAARGVDAIFAMSTPYEGGPERETREAFNLVNAAREARVQHLVYSSVAGAGELTGVPFFDSKNAIEEHIKSVDVPYTIVAPVFFMENLLASQMHQSIRAGILAMPLPPNRKLQQIAAADIGNFVALVVGKRDPFLARRIELASDELAGVEMARALTRITGRHTEYMEIPVGQVRGKNPEIASMWDWFNRVGYHAPLQRLRRSYPEVGWHSFEEWAREQHWGASTRPTS